MNDIRNRYLQAIPLLALALLFITIGEIYFFEIQTPTQRDTIATGAIVLSFLKNLVLWAGIGWAFQKTKEAAIAMGVAIVVTVVNYCFPTGHHVTETGFLQYLSYALLNFFLLPVFVFAFLCFKKISKLTGFLFIWVIIYVFHIYSFGGTLMELSPYNKWYKFLQIEGLLEIHSGNKTYQYINIFRYSTVPMWCSTFILFSECMYAAGRGISVKNVFKFDFSTRYSWATTLTLFYVLRISMNLLIVGIFMFPFSYFSKNKSYHIDLNPVMFTLILLAGILCLSLTVVYYRKFLVEYFISLKKKISWLYWLVNLPIVGLLAFPLIILTFQHQGPIEDRSAFYRFHRINQNTRSLLWAIMALNVVSALFSAATGSTSNGYWILLLAELAFCIWYSATITGYYAMLITGGACYIIFLILIYQLPAVTDNSFGRVLSFSYDPALLKIPVSLWMLSGFSIVQFAVLLPVFHLNAMDAVKQAATSIEHQHTH